MNSLVVGKIIYFYSDASLDWCLYKNLHNIPYAYMGAVGVGGGGGCVYFSPRVYLFVFIYLFIFDKYGCFILFLLF